MKITKQIINYSIMMYKLTNLISFSFKNNSNNFIFILIFNNYTLKINIT